MASANNLGTAYIKIAPSMVGIQSAITKGFTTYGSDAGTAFNKGFVLKNSAVATTIATATSKALSSITSRIDDAIARVDTLRVFPKIMKNLGYEAEESSSAVQLLSDRIEGLPTTLDEIVSYTQRLASTMGSLNKGTKNATKLAIAFNDAALAGGKGQAEANRAFEQFVQVISRGRPSMQDWKIMMEVMPGQLKQMARYMYDNNGSLRDYAKNAKKTADQLDGMDLYEWISENKNEKAKERLNDLTTAIIELDENGGSGIQSFKDQVGDATHTIGTAMRLIPVRITKALATVIEAFGADDIYNTLDKFTKSFKGVGNWVAQNIVPIIKNQVIPVIKNLLVAAKNVVEFIANNKWVQNTLRILLDTIIAFKVVKSAKSIIAGLIAPVASLVKGIVSATTAFKAAHAAGLTFSTSMGAAATASTGAASSVAGFASKVTASRGALAGFGTTITTLGSALGILALAYVDIKAITEIVKTNTIKAETALRDYENRHWSAKRAVNEMNKSLNVQKSIMEDLKESTKKLEDAEYDYLVKKSETKKVEQEYNELKKSGKATADELRIKELELNRARNEEKEGLKKLNKEQADKNALDEEYMGNQLAAINIANKTILSAELQRGAYNKVAMQLDDLKNKTLTYKDQNGKMVQASKQASKDMVDYIAYELSRGNDVWAGILKIAEEKGISFTQAMKEYGQTGAKRFMGDFSAGVITYKPLLTDAVSAAGKSLNDILKGWAGAATASGQNWIIGLINGISNGSLIKKLNNKITEIGDSVVKKLNKQWKIGSPSRIAAQIGRYFDMGLINGLDSYADKIVSVSDSIAQGVVDSFDKSAAINAGQVQPMAPAYGQLGASESDNAKVIQNNVFNQVDSELDVKEASRLLGWQVATTI